VLAVMFAVATAALGVWLARSHAFAPIFAACGAVAFLLFARSQSDAVRSWARSRVARVVRQCAAALGRESYGIYLWHFICVYVTFHFFAETFRQSDKDVSLALYAVTVMIALMASYGLSRLSDRLIQGRATRLSRKLLKQVDACFGSSR
jgi:peptidoglycan/LPS O-acetylase OafA/YrhL